MKRFHPFNTPLCDSKFFQDHFVLVFNFFPAFVTNPHTNALHNAFAGKTDINSMKLKSIFKVNFAKTSIRNHDYLERRLEEGVFIGRRLTFSFLALCLVSSVQLEPFL